MIHRELLKKLAYSCTHFIPLPPTSTTCALVRDSNDKELTCETPTSGATSHDHQDYAQDNDQDQDDDQHDPADSDSSSWK